MNGLLNLAFVVLKYIAAASIALSASVLLAGHRLVKLSKSPFRATSLESEETFVVLGIAKEEALPSKVILR